MNADGLSLDGKSPAIAKDYMGFSTENKGIFRIGAVDCDDQPKICEKEKVNAYPTMKIYPPFPAPAFDVDTNGNFEVK